MAFGYDFGKFDDIVAFLAFDFVRVEGAGATGPDTVLFHTSKSGH